VNYVPGCNSVFSIAAHISSCGRRLLLVDSGSCCSILAPKDCQNYSSSLCSIQLKTASGSPIHVLGEISATISLQGLRRAFQWNFVVANVTQSILGADFLSASGLLVDCRNRRLFDQTTSLASNLSASCIISPVVSISSQRTDTNHPALRRLLEKHCRIFGPLSIDEVKHSTQHFIETEGPPVFARSRQLHPDKQRIAEHEFQHMISTGVIRPSRSSWSSPLHLVPKKTPGEWRPCGDYRELNKRTKFDRYPIPHIQSFNCNLAGCSFFSKLDLCRAFNQIPMSPADIEKTAVITPFGLFEWLKMPFGLRNAAQTMQRFLDDIFRGCPFVFKYIDDLLIASANEEEHLKHLSDVFVILENAGLRCSMDKCEFLRRDIAFLGFSVSSAGVKPSVDRCVSIRAMERPSDYASLRRCLGVLNFYRRFVPNFAQTVSPLQLLANAAQPRKNTRQSLPFVWTGEHSRSFECIKTAICSAVCLSHPHPACSHMTLTTDASSVAAGAALHQVFPNGASEPLAFFSKQFSPTQQRYSTFDRELTAIYLAVQHFRSIIEGKRVVVFTDHKPIAASFCSVQQPKSSRQERYFSVISEFVSSVQFISGAENIVADCLSRNVCDATDSPPLVNSVSVDAIDLPAIAAAQLADPATHEVFPDAADFKQYNGVWCEVSGSIPRPYLPVPLRKPIFDSLHNLSHPGVKSSQKLILQRFWWPNSKREIALWCRDCRDCQQCKITRHTKTPLGELPVPSARFTEVHIDIVGPLDTICGFSYLFTAIDRFTGFPVAVPIADMRAETIAEAFVSGWVSLFGVPLHVITDRGTQFESELFSHLSKLLGFHRLRTTSYHPACNGKVERLHRRLKTAIKCRRQDWLAALPIVLWSIRSLPMEGFPYSPFTLVTGSCPNLPQALINSYTPTAAADDAELRRSLDDFARRLQSPAAEAVPHSQPKSFVPAALRECPYVWLRTDRVRKPLEAPYTGPFAVVGRADKVYVIRMDTGRLQTVSIDRLKPAYGIHNGQQSLLPVVVPPDDFLLPERDDPPATPPDTGLDETIPYGKRSRRVRFQDDFVYY
jgi:transposase InsO family protein